MLRQFPSWRTTSSSGSTSTAPEREEAWLVKQASALLTDVEAGILASNCVICNDKRGWKPADDSDAGSTPPILCWKLAFSLELQLKARGRGSGMWDLRSRKNRTHDLKIIWDSLLNVDKEKARHGLQQYANTSNFDGKLETVRNAYKDFQYLTDSPHRDCKKALRSLVLLNMGFMKAHASPYFCRHQITPKISRYTRCSMSMLPNVSINRRIRSSGQLGRWWYSISPCRNNECVRRFTVFAFNQRS